MNSFAELILATFHLVVVCVRIVKWVNSEYIYIYNIIYGITDSTKVQSAGNDTYSSSRLGIYESWGHEDSFLYRIRGRGMV